MVKQWAARHSVSQAALNELYDMLKPDMIPAPGAKGSESHIDSLIMLEAAQKDVTLFRNNVGACQDKTGRLIRYGLANESTEMNAQIKSSDRIGWRTVIITPDMVGNPIAQFVMREIKKASWTGRTLSPHEQAQANFMIMGLLAGCDVGFANKAGTL
jgi:hypothetical protein